MLKHLAVLALVGACASPAMAQQSTVDQPMAFDSCVAQLQTLPPSASSSQTTQDTTDVQEKKYQMTSGGQVTATCSRATGNLTLKSD